MEVTGGVRRPPPHGPNTGNETHPIMEKDEDEKSDQNGKRQGEGFLAHDGFEQVAQGFD